MIDRTTKNIKKILKYFGGNGYSKNINNKKNTLQGFGGNTYSKNIKYKNFLFIYLFIFVFPICKRANYKNGSNIS